VQNTIDGRTGFQFNSTAKYHVGALRPHFFQVCSPSVSCNLANTADPFHFYAADEYECLGSNAHRIKEARLSFPSGHASLSFYTATYLIVSR
jgi:phosphatidate phosphatase